MLNDLGKQENVQRISVQFSRSVVSDSVTPWITARQASLSIRYIYGYNFYIFLMDWPFHFYIFLMDWPFCHCEIFFFISGNIFLYVLKSILSDISQYSHSTFVVVAVCMIYLLSVYLYLSKQSVSLIEKIQVDLFFFNTFWQSLSLFGLFTVLLIQLDLHLLLCF